MQVNVEATITRAEMRDIHHALQELPPESEVALHLADNLRAHTPGQFTAWMQLVLTWGQKFAARQLQLSDETLNRVAADGELSDLEVLAMYLASSITSADGTDVTADVAPKARLVLERRRVLTRHKGDGSPSLSLILAQHSLTNRVSPELHARWNAADAVEETARTLYHDIWVDSGGASDLRKPLLEFGERALPPQSPTHVSRVVSPIQEDDSPFRSLGSRAPRIRGLALAMATEVRQREKPVHDEIGEVLFELVQNTQWHATKWGGGTTGANCRLLHMREFDFDPAADTDVSYDPSYVAYARAAVREAERRSGNPITRATFGAVSVIDSGVGLARSAALSMEEGHLLNPHSEIRYLIAALNKSLKVRRADMGNIGLSRVQQLLTNLRGYMSIRTGTVQIRRDFVTNPLQTVAPFRGEVPPTLFIEWVPPEEDELTVGERIGTSVTVVYPVAFEGSAP